MLNPRGSMGGECDDNGDPGDVSQRRGFKNSVVSAYSSTVCCMTSFRCRSSGTRFMLDCDVLHHTCTRMTSSKPATKRYSIDAHTPALHYRRRTRATVTYRHSR